MPAAPSDRVAGRLAHDDAVRPDPAGQDRRPWLVSDLRRFGIATAVCVVLTAAYVAVVVVVEPSRVGALPFVATIYFGAWAAYALTYVLLTWATLRPADGGTLRSWLSESRAGRRRRRRAESLAGIGGPAGAVSFCLLALAAVIGATVVPRLRGDPLVLPLAVAVVVTTWLLIVTVFALHYAREDTQIGGLNFDRSGDTGTDAGAAAGAAVDDPTGPRFGDYFFLSVQVSTAYASADVGVTRTAIRRTLITHTVVAFVFNSILIALVVSLITLSAAT